MLALKLVPQVDNMNDTLFSLSNLDFHVHKSKGSGWNGIITKLDESGKTVVMCCSSEYKDDVISWAMLKIRD